MTAAQRPLVILDRDGVINRDSPDFIKSPEEFIPLPGSLAAIAALCDAGFEVVIASNQSGVGRGLLSIETLERIHVKLRTETEAVGGVISGIFFCPHHPDDGCDCRKPKPGLFEQVSTTYRRDLHGVPTIGDSRRDLDAALAAGARPILVRTGNGRKTERELGADSDVEVYDDLSAAAAALIDACERNTT
ncbi:MAG: D-glycero-beta-D-manno-heptose 1,7-bisphosphate 7-phosphatase [Gammaproteobacteria bacterium]|nr:D-glycero-beta-D-manno-heptose 1,7-bisphosphate 7-phosphatase [Gammaproteobacteria bacterium]NND36825.1 D-glycero-beta-D-manno-heptose 1,7-bisphosphate 7-phosphatase [Gammaproteobacteria bacterium]